MGGLGSGNYTRMDAKGAVESRLSIDVREWRREGLLYAGHSFPWSWPRADNERRIGVQVGLGHVRLKYRVWRTGQAAEQVDEVIQLSATPCSYGGLRDWFVCPGQSCGRRVAVLYSGSKYFRCRRCSGLAYTSQREDRR